MPAIAGAQAAPRQPAPPPTTRPQPAAPAADDAAGRRRAAARDAAGDEHAAARHRRSGQRSAAARPAAGADGARRRRCRRSPARSAPTPSPPARSPAARRPGRRSRCRRPSIWCSKYQPRLSLAAQDTLTARAQLQQANGLFDTTFTFAPGADYTQQPVAPGFLRQQLNNRTLMKQLHLGFTRANLQLRDILANSNAPLPRCPLTSTSSSPPTPSPSTASTEARWRRSASTRISSRSSSPTSSSRSASTCAAFCNGALNQDPLDAILFDLSYGRLVAIDQGRPFGLEGILLSGVEAPKEAVRLLAEISEAVAARARLALERLGPLPKDQFTRHVSLRTALNKPLRNGMTASVELLLESEENNFRDKTLDPTFGGAGFPPRFPSSLTFGLLMPLGRGRGSVSVAAQERASVFTVRAREEQARQIATEEVYRTLLAYIRLIAAQENLKLAQASAERQKSLVGLIDLRVRGGEAARVEGSRAQARAAVVESSVAGAQAELVDARMSLAEAMGIDAASLGEAPAASDRFADVRVDQQTVADAHRLGDGVAARSAGAR